MCYKTRSTSIIVSEHTTQQMLRQRFDRSLYIIPLFPSQSTVCFSFSTEYVHDSIRPIVLDNPHCVGNHSDSLDRQMWLDAGNVVRWRYHFYNSTDITFDDIGHYFVWIHLRLALFPFPVVDLHQ